MNFKSAGVDAARSPPARTLPLAEVVPDDRLAAGTRRFAQPQEPVALLVGQPPVLVDARVVVRRDLQALPGQERQLVRAPIAGLGDMQAARFERIGQLTNLVRLVAR